MISIKIDLKFEQITTEEEVVMAVLIYFVEKHLHELSYRRIRNPKAYIECDTRHIAFAPKSCYLADGKLILLILHALRKNPS